MTHRHGLLIDNITLGNNQATTEILETHNYNHLALYGKTNANAALVLLGANDKNSNDWYKCGDIAVSEKHFLGSTFGTDYFDLFLNTTEPPPFIKIGNISGANATELTLLFKMSKR
tara:strand:- start:1422 stop:1769 length:348 start_codon:yes stop_codon:yes gene_type:complete